MAEDLPQVEPVAVTNFTPGHLYSAPSIDDHIRICVRSINSTVILCRVTDGSFRQRVGGGDPAEGTYYDVTDQYVLTKESK